MIDVWICLDFVVWPFVPECAHAHTRVDLSLKLFAFVASFRSFLCFCFCDFSLIYLLVTSNSELCEVLIRGLMRDMRRE
jgi:hypothetical protein